MYGLVVKTSFGVWRLSTRYMPAVGERITCLYPYHRFIYCLDNSYFGVQD